ncbi:hypothetical protein LINGRAHAP2_LOCUS33616 [Linum grandiflorum]
MPLILLCNLTNQVGRKVTLLRNRNYLHINEVG